MPVMPNEARVTYRVARTASWIVLALVWIVGASLNISVAQDANAANSPTIVAPNLADAKAQACVRIMEQFIHELDAVMTENPKSTTRYYLVLTKWLSFKSGIRGLPPPYNAVSVEGCNINQFSEISRRSKFFYKIYGPPLYENYRVLFQNAAITINIGVNKNTGDIYNPVTKWRTVFP